MVQLEKLCNLNKAVKRKWIRALRSGKYKRGRNTMRSDFYTAAGKKSAQHCCLAVLCEVMAEPYLGDAGRPNENFRNRIGLSDDALYSLIGMNDGRANERFTEFVPKKYLRGWKPNVGTSFNKIADFIRDRM